MSPGELHKGDDALHRICKKRWGILAIAVLVLAVLTLALAIRGYRFTAEAARRALPDFGGGEVLLREVVADGVEWDLVELDGRCATICCLRHGPLWRAASGPRIQNRSDDAVELLNRFWIEDGLGWIVLLSHDPAVDRCRITMGSQTVTAPVALDQPTGIILYPCTQLNMGLEFAAEALKRDGTTLYRLDESVADGIILAGERWLPEARTAP